MSIIAIAKLTGDDKAFALQHPWTQDTATLDQGIELAARRGLSRTVERLGRIRIAGSTSTRSLREFAQQHAASRYASLRDLASKALLTAIADEGVAQYQGQSVRFLDHRTAVQVPALLAADGRQGWTVYGFESLEAAHAWAADNQNLRMPCWRRKECWGGRELGRSAA